MLVLLSTAGVFAPGTLVTDNVYFSNTTRESHEFSTVLW
jgi:hypothetical protein